MTPNKLPRGVLAASVTAFTDDLRSVDEDRMFTHVRRMHDQGVDGLVVCGSTGEFTSLTHAERRRVVEVTIAAADTLPVIAQTGAMTTSEAVELSQHAQASGAVAVMVTIPYFTPLLEAEIVAYYDAIARSIDIPVIIYHIPSANGVTFRADFLRELTQIQGVDYVKESSGDGDLLRALVDQRDPEIGVYGGVDTTARDVFQAGAQGLIVGCANFVTPQLRGLLSENDSAQPNSAGFTNFYRLQPLLEYINNEVGYVAGIKAACAFAGVCVGGVRPPALDLTPAQRRQLDHLMCTSGLTSR